MSFLTPLYIAGTLFVALPIIFHLIRRTPRDRIPFSSLMFLRESPPRVTRRSRLENILLLLLRGIAVILLALAFARPFLREPVLADTDSGDGQVIAIVVDTSASMRRGDLWRQAVEHVTRTFGTIRPIDHVAVFAFDRQVRPLVSFQQWLETPAPARVGLIQSQLSSLTPSWGSTGLGAALAAAADAVDSHATRTAPSSRVLDQRIVLVTDMQKGSDLTGLRQFDWPDQVSVKPTAVLPVARTNAAIQLVADRDDLPQIGSANRRRVRVSNAADSTASQFRLRWENADSATTEAYVVPGKSRLVQAPPPPTNGDVDRLTVEGDDHDFDNAAYIVMRSPQAVSVLFVGRGPATDPKSLLYYFARAFPESRLRSVHVLAREPNENLTAAELASVRFAVLADAVPESTARALGEFVLSGGTLLAVLTSPAGAGSVGRVLDVAGLSAEEATVREYAMLGEIDFRHPLFAPFADPRYGDFTKIHIWRHRRIEIGSLPDARVLAKFDDRSGALVEIPRGHGRVYLLTTGWQPDDSQLAVSSKFVPLVNGMLDSTIGAAEFSLQLRVGEPAPLPEFGTSSVRMRLPDGTERELAAGSREFVDTMSPGIYELVGSPTPLRFAVNLDAAESQTEPLPVEELEQLGVRLTAERSSSKIEADAANHRQMLAFELESRQKLWRWLIVVALGVVLIESWLAGRLSVRTS